MKTRLALLLLLFSCAPAQARDSRPNLIFLLTDDQRADDLGCYGNTVIQTPHIDSLAQRGVRFTRFFVTSSICMASRASYFTGRVERSHACNFYYRSLAAKDWAQSYPVLLKQAGYHTGFIGKFGVSVEGVAQGLPRTDLDAFEGFPGQGEYFPQGKGGPHLERVMGDQAVRFLRGATKKGKPFCLSVSFKAPHDPLTPDPAFAQRYENEPPYLPAPLPFREIAGLPPAFGDSAWYARLSWQQHCSSEDKLHAFIRQRYRLIAGVDAAVGRILAELQKLGLAENTVILFSSDNGYYYGEHGLNTKFYLHEESIRVPLLIMDPRLPQQAGATVDALTANMDVAPTLLDLAALPAPAAMQGRSLLPLLRGETPSDWRDAILCENLAKERRPMCDAIRTKDWKYIAYFETRPLQEELYHLTEDPREQRNLAGAPGHLGTKEQLARQLQAMRVKLSGTADGFPEWIQTQKEHTANWQGYRAAYQALGQAQTSPLRHWTLDQPKSDSWLIHGEAMSVAGAKGGALKLDGHSVIELKDSAHLGSRAGDFTFTVWCNPFLPTGGQRMIAAKNRYSQNEREWGVMVDEDGKFRLYVQQGGWKKVEARTQPKAGHWHHIGLVLRGKTAELWVNGALEGKAALKEGPSATAAPITLGGVLDGTPRQTFSGALDEARYEPRALSPAEMTVLYQPVTATLPVPEAIQPVILWSETQPVPKTADLPVLSGVRFSVIKPYEFKKDGYRFLHGVGLGFHKERLYASFGHNKGGENTDTEEARFCVSEDEGRTWSAVRTMDDGGPDFAVSHGVFLSHKGTLWAFMGSYTGTMVGIHTRAYRLNETTGEFEKLGVIVKSGFWPMQEPVRMDDGNWIMSGITAGGDAPAGGKNPAAVAISHGDDWLKWDLVPISQVPGLGKVWGESAVIVEGKRITNISRYGAEARALIATSEDYGRTWTAMRPSNLPMATSKPYAGVLSTGQRYLVCSTSADGGGRRSPLTLALTKPGETQFSQVFVIRHALFPEGPGESHERASLSYPYAIEHEGKLYVGYSNNGGNVGRIGEGRELWNNNSAELAIIPLGGLSITPRTENLELRTKKP